MPHLKPATALSGVFVQLAGGARRVAVIGIKTADKASQPAYFVPQYLQQEGVKIYPVPVREGPERRRRAETRASSGMQHEH